MGLHSNAFVIVSGATNDSCWKKIGEYSHCNHISFADRFGGTDMMVDLSKEQNKRPASWGKLLALRRLSGLPMIWIDSDCLFANESKPSDFLAPSSSMRLARDKNGWNCGVMSFPNESWVPPFLTRWWDIANPKEITHCWWEQCTFQHHQHEWKDRIGEPISLDKFIHAAGIHASQKLGWLKSKTKVG